MAKFIQRQGDYSIYELEAKECKQNQKKRYQDYIYRELDRGIRRGGENYPTKSALTLKW